MRGLALSKRWRPFSSSNKALVAAAQCPAVNPSHRQRGGESWPQALIKAESGNCCNLESLMAANWCAAWRNPGTDIHFPSSLCVFCTSLPPSTPPLYCFAPSHMLNISVRSLRAAAQPNQTNKKKQLSLAEISWLNF